MEHNAEPSGIPDGSTGDIAGKIEYPPAGGLVEGKRMAVGGWAFARDGGDIDIDITVDGKQHDSAQWGLPRFDVYSKHQREEAYLSAFFAKVDISELGDGQHTLQVSAKHGRQTTNIGSITFRKGTASLPRRVMRRILRVTPGITNTSPDPVGLVEAIVPVGGRRSIRSSGLDFVKRFIEIGGLDPAHDVLEVGCGMGRFAVPITQLTREGGGTYTGLDILPHAISYLNQHIGRRYPNFSARIADVHNELYNPGGRYAAYEYRFPFPDGSFDFVLLQSVFTHMVRRDTENYIREIARILKPGGRSFITYFLLNDEAWARIRNGDTERTFQYEFDGYRADSKRRPEVAIAYDEGYIHDLYKANGLQIVTSRYGRWRGDRGALQPQDFIVAAKHGGAAS